MNGKVIIGLGLLLVVLGGVGLYYAYEAENPAGAALAWAGIIVGTLALLGGIGRFMTDFMAPQRALEAGYGRTELRLLVEAMGAMAAADGNIADREIAEIAEIHERMLGVRITPDEVREILGAPGGNANIAARLAAERPHLSPQLRRLIVHCCYLVMMSDLVEDRRERATIGDIGQALGFAADEVDDMIARLGD